MGLLDKMKSGLQSVANRVTGGYGEVSIEFHRSTYFPGQKVEARIVVKAVEALKVTKITVDVQGSESLSFHDPTHGPDLEASCRHYESTLDAKREIAGEFELAAGESREFLYELGLSKDLSPSCGAEHLKSVYTLKVEVDIPWGVDLRKSEDIQVIALPRFLSEIGVGRGNAACQAQLKVKDSASPGEQLSWNLALKALETVLVKRVTAKLLSMESFEAELTRKTENPKYAQEQARRQAQQGHPNSEQNQQMTEQQFTYETFHERIEVTAREHSEAHQDQVRIEAGKVHPITGTLTVPEDFPLTYQRGQLEHRVVLCIVVEIAERPSLEFREEIFLCHSGPFQEAGTEYTVEAFLEQAQKNQAELVELFLDAGMDPNVRIEAPTISVQGGLSGLGAALDKAAEKASQPGSTEHVGGTAAHLAARFGGKRSLQLLLERGADFSVVDQNQEGLLHAAARGNSTETVDFLLNSGCSLEAKAVDQSTPLHSASREGNPTMLEHLLGKEADVKARNNHGHGPLHFASAGGHSEAIKLLLSKGFDLEEAMSEGATPLWTAAFFRQEQAVAALLAAGANAQVQNLKGLTALHCAATQGDQGIAQLLLDSKLDPNTPDEDGETALHYAVRAGHQGMVELFMSKGVDKNPINKTNQTPLTVARLQGRSGIEQVLRAAGGKEFEVEKP